MPEHLKKELRLTNHDTDLVEFPRGFILSNGDVSCVPENFREIDSNIDGLRIWLEKRAFGYRAAAGGVQVHVFGFVVDTLNAETSIDDIVGGLAQAALEGKDALLTALDSIGGRYAVLAVAPDYALLVGDAGGARSIFYHMDGEAYVCASHSLLIARMIGADEIAIANDLQSYGEGYRARNWPGRLSKYERVLALTPNTYLDLNSLRPRRFFALAPLVEIDADQAAQKVSGYLSTAAANFFRNYLPGGSREAVVFLTGGIDSRLVLSALSGFENRLSAYSYDVNGAHLEDITLARRIADDLSIPHYIDDGTNSHSSETTKVASLNAANPYLGLKSVLNYARDNLSGAKFALRGNFGEISRGVFSARLAFKDRPALFMSRVWRKGSENHRPIREAFEDYADGVEFSKSKWPIRILYYWEHKHATWHAANLNELDNSFDTFNIMNSRNIIEAMCSVSLEEQKGCAVHGKTIKHLSPKLLDYPLKYKGF